MIKRRLWRKEKHQQFVDLAMEFFGQPNRRTVRKPKDVWFKTSQRKKIVVDILYRQHFREEEYDGVVMMVYVVQKIRILQVGRYKFPYPIEVHGVNIPAPGGYIHEKSLLYQLLKDLKKLAGSLGR